MSDSKGTTFPTDANNSPIWALRPRTTHTLSFTGTSQQTPAFNKNTIVVRVYANQDCFLEFGLNPTATSSSMPLPAGVVEYFKVQDAEKIAAIQISAAGSLYVTELR